MELKKNVAAAITAAVHLYLQAEQQPLSPPLERFRFEPPRPPYSPWALAGRQATMEMRRMWQMRLAR
jgi:hypothetical protein